MGCVKMNSQFQADYIGFVGTTSTRGSKGVYQIGLNAASGELRVLDVKSAYNSGYLTIAPNRKNLYVLSEGMTFQGKGSGGITAFDLRGGAFREQNAMVTGGQRPCFVNCDRKSGEIYVGNFYSGSIAVYEPKPDGSLKRQKAILRHPKLGSFGPAIHCVTKCPTGRYLLALELSGDCVYVYDEARDYQIVWREPLEQRCAPRHMVFSEDGRYVYINRQADERVSVYAFHPDRPQKLELRQTVSVRTADMKGKTEPAAIRLCPGKNLLAVSNRGMGSANREDSISLFSIRPEDGTLTLRRVVRTGGQMPRDFNFTPDGDYLVVGYQFQGYLDVYRVNAEEADLVCVGRGTDIPSPVCIAF